LDSLTYVGHGTVELRLGETSILTDPFLRNWLGPLHRQGPAPDPAIPGRADLVLISHLHRDHMDVRSLGRISPDTPVVVPRGATKWPRKAGARDIRELDVGEKISFGGIEVTAVTARHNGYRDDHRGEPIQPLGYVIEADGMKTYFAGDTDLYEGMAELGPLDLALLPIWGWGPYVGSGHLNPASAAQALELIRPRLAVPIHWGTFYPAGLRWLRPQYLVEPPLQFAQRTSERVPEVQVEIVQPGASLSPDRI
jgi:L-ascorbate metabolism protein UlaG (beta-lactamase superfamily)